MPPGGLSVERTIIIQAPPRRVMAAFFEPADLLHWWHVVRAVTVPRPLGTYSLEWAPTDYRDELLGQLGGTFHGTVMEYLAGVEFFVADAYWSPPEGEPIGPMALEVRCALQGATHMTRLVVRQSGEDEGARWQRYFDVAAAGWQQGLGELKHYLDTEALRSRRAP